MESTWTALSAAETGFALLVARPSPMLFDARDLHGLPHRMLALDELRDLLVHQRVAPDVSDAVWRQLATHVRDWGREWVTAACGIAAPGLTRMAVRLCRGHHDRAGDVDAEILTRFLQELRTMDLAPPRVWLRLCWAAWRAGLRSLPVHDTDELPIDLPAGGHAPSRPYGHPDVLLARATAAAVITVEQAELIGATRFGDAHIDVLAAQAGLPSPVLRMRRRRAEHALAAAIHNGALADVADRRPRTQSAARTRRALQADAWTVLHGPPGSGQLTAAGTPTLVPSA
jgi:hypothetical protein